MQRPWVSQTSPHHATLGLLLVQLQVLEMHLLCVTIPSVTCSGMVFTPLQDRISSGVKLLLRS